MYMYCVLVAEWWRRETMYSMYINVFTHYTLHRQYFKSLVVRRKGVKLWRLNFMLELRQFFIWDWITCMKDYECVRLGDVKRRSFKWPLIREHYWCNKISMFYIQCYKSSYVKKLYNFMNTANSVCWNFIRFISWIQGCTDRVMYKSVALTLLLN